MRRELVSPSDWMCRSGLVDRSSICTDGPSPATLAPHLQHDASFSTGDGRRGINRLLDRNGCCRHSMGAYRRSDATSRRFRFHLSRAQVAAHHHIQCATDNASVAGVLGATRCCVRRTCLHGSAGRAVLLSMIRSLRNILRPPRLPATRMKKEGWVWGAGQRQVRCRVDAWRRRVPSEGSGEPPLPSGGG